MTTVNYDRARMDMRSRGAQEYMSANAWDEAFTHCQRCGTWCHWQDAVEEGGCPTCQGKEVRDGPAWR